MVQGRHIIISGIPASGKTTIGLAIANELGLEMLDKDEILEALFVNKGVGDIEWRARLSREADEILRERALQSKGAVISSWWRHPASTIDSGTRIEWLSELRSELIEVHCVCAPETAAARFKARIRHSGHLDRLKLDADLVSSFKQQAALGPLGLGRVIVVNTEKPVEVTQFVRLIESLLDPS
jgi:predicted kinase